MTAHTRERLLRLAPYLVVLAACLSLSDKPFHIDDANFLHFAADVLANPLRPFLAGAIHSNPPGHQYLLALLLLALAALLSLWRGHRRALVPLLALAAAFLFWTWLSAVQLGAPQTLSPVAVAGSLGTGGGLLRRRLLSAACALLLVTALGPGKLLLQPERGARRALELLGAAAIAGVTVWPVAPLAAAGALLLAAAWFRLPAATRAPGPLFGLDPDVLFLLLWAASGLAVPVLYNQSAAKYFNLPQIPLLLLLVRAAGAQAEAQRARAGLAAAAVCVVIALPLLLADLREATARRDLIVEQVAKAKASGAGTVWAAGTPWGMLAYSVRSGARFASSALEPGSVEARALAPGDQVIDLSWPGSLALPAGDVALLEERTLEDAYPLRLMSGGAGYWSSVWGIAPFVFSTEPYQRCWRVRVLNKIHER